MKLLQRLPGSRFSEVLPSWGNRAVVILGGGPSLTSRQLVAVSFAHQDDRVRLIAVNDAYLWAPWADVCYAADPRWHRWHTDGVSKPHLGLSPLQVRDSWKYFAGEKCSIESACSGQIAEDVHLLRNRDHPYHGVGLSRDPAQLVTGRNGGFQALNLASLSGAKLVILLGFDGQTAGDGRTHWHGSHQRATPPQAYDEYRKSFSAAEAELEAVGVRVINASPGSAINSFEKADIEVALAAT